MTTSPFVVIPFFRQLLVLQVRGGLPGWWEAELSPSRMWSTSRYGYPWSTAVECQRKIHNTHWVARAQLHTQYSCWGPVSMRLCTAKLFFGFHLEVHDQVFSICLYVPSECKTTKVEKQFLFRKRLRRQRLTPVRANASHAYASRGYRSHVYACKHADWNPHLHAHTYTQTPPHTSN